MKSKYNTTQHSISYSPLCPNSPSPTVATTVTLTISRHLNDASFPFLPPFSHSFGCPLCVTLTQLLNCLCNTLTVQCNAMAVTSMLVPMVLYCLWPPLTKNLPKTASFQHHTILYYTIPCHTILFACTLCCLMIDLTMAVAVAIFIDTHSHSHSHSMLSLSDSRVTRPNRIKWSRTERNGIKGMTWAMLQSVGRSVDRPVNGWKHSTAQHSITPSKDYCSFKEKVQQNRPAGWSTIRRPVELNKPNEIDSNGMEPNLFEWEPNQIYSNLFKPIKSKKATASAVHHINYTGPSSDQPKSQPKCNRANLKSPFKAKAKTVSGCSRKPQTNATGDCATATYVVWRNGALAFQPTIDGLMEELCGDALHYSLLQATMR